MIIIILPLIFDYLSTPFELLKTNKSVNKDGKKYHLSINYFLKTRNAGEQELESGQETTLLPYLLTKILQSHVVQQLSCQAL